MNIDNATLTWALVLFGFTLLGFTGALFYFADKRTAKKR